MTESTSQEIPAIRCMGSSKNTKLSNWGQSRPFLLSIYENGELMAVLLIMICVWPSQGPNTDN
jgi:hypothetical protein